MKEYEIEERVEKLEHEFYFGKAEFNDTVLSFLSLILKILIEILKDVRKTYSKLI
jgi:hypothetical protein